MRAVAKRFGKRDLLFLGILSALLFLGCAVFYLTGLKQGAAAEVTVDGTLYGTYPLNRDRTVDIRIGDTRTNVLVIQNGTADMTEANCPDRLCVHQKAISRANETIVCLPNKVVVAIKGGRQRKLDATA